MAENGLEMKLSEPQASLLRFPFFDLHRREPAGQRLCVAFFCFRFLAKQEKGVAAGLPPASNRPTRPEAQTRPATANQKQHASNAHIPCGFQASVLGEAHGICAVALPVL
jgi:hypothetical protein